ncbi:MAG: arsenate reductase-like glutaredoxin family protein [Glaciecola sp.]
MGDRGATIREMVDAKKQRFGADDLEGVLEGVRHLMVAKGKKILRFDLAGDPEPEELHKAMLGPSGNLRAPTIKVGKQMLVGFHEEAYAEVFGD